MIAVAFGGVAALTIVVIELGGLATAGLGATRLPVATWSVAIVFAALGTLRVVFVVPSVTRKVAGHLE